MGLALVVFKNNYFRTRGFRFFLALIAALAAHLFSPSLRAQESVVQLDATQTKIEFTLSDVLHTVHGTFRLKTGTIRFDPSTKRISGTIAVDATSGESGNDSRDRKMHREILESEKFPEIIFSPNQVMGSFATEGSYRVEVQGQFRIHGTDHKFSFPVSVQQEGQNLRLSAHLTIPYVQWGLRNPSTFLLRVSDKVIIDINAVGQAVKGEASP